MATPFLAPLPGDTGPRRSLILAGGGMRVAYQAGVLRALDEEGLRFFHGDGTSGGTINLAMLLSGLSAQEMCDRWRVLNVKDFDMGEVSPWLTIDQRVTSPAAARAFPCSFRPGDVRRRAVPSGPGPRGPSPSDGPLYRCSLVLALASPWRAKIRYRPDRAGP